MADTDPLDRWRLVRVGTEMLAQFGTRSEAGDRITAEWGEPDEQGVYEPTFTTHHDDNLLDAVAAGRTAGLRESERFAANAILDRPGADPDDDAAIVARAVLRIIEEDRRQPAPADCHICHRPLTGDDWRTFDDNGRIYAVCGVCISQGDEG